jgi:hypothetical protein
MDARRGHDVSAVCLYVDTFAQRSDKPTAWVGEVVVIATAAGLGVHGFWERAILTDELLEGVIASVSGINIYNGDVAA